MQEHSHYRVALHQALLDPRTKIALLLLLAVFALGGTGGPRLELFRAALSLLPFVLLLTAHPRVRDGVMLAILVACNAYALLLFTGTGGAGELLLALVSNIATRLIPCAAMASYAMRTTTVSEFIAAMERVHMPAQLTIPLSVMFRFFPTIRENAANIHEAMRMRGASSANVSKLVEYQLVPLVECTTRASDDLAASALVRGLGGPVRRTNIAAIGFHAADAVIAAVIVVAVVISWEVCL